MTELEKQGCRLYQIMEDNDYRYHVYPHYGCVPDWFIAYKELAGEVMKYLKMVETSIDSNGQEKQEVEQQS